MLLAGPNDSTPRHAHYAAKFGSIRRKFRPGARAPCASVGRWRTAGLPPPCRGRISLWGRIAWRGNLTRAAKSATIQAYAEPRRAPRTKWISRTPGRFCAAAVAPPRNACGDYPPRGRLLRRCNSCLMLPVLSICLIADPESGRI